MDFEYSARVADLREQVADFMREHVYPAEAAYRAAVDEGESRWSIPPIMEELKEQARQAGLWNLFLPESEFGAGLSNLEYAPLAEQMGRSLIGSEVFNCSAPDTGNMEVLVRYGSDSHKNQWLGPLLRGRDSFGVCNDRARCCFI